VRSLIALRELHAFSRLKVSNLRGARRILQLGFGNATQELYNSACYAPHLATVSKGNQTLWHHPRYPSYVAETANHWLQWRGLEENISQELDLLMRSSKIPRQLPSGGAIHVIEYIPNCWGQMQPG
jgi:hypothetical protein